MALQVLVTGSRDASPAMLAKAQQVVMWCYQEGHTVIVGDAPGVDRQVRLTCVELLLRPHVFGAYGRIREPEIGAISEQRVPTQGTYPQRDVLMAQACDWCVALWNGKSRGTKLTFEAARRLGKRVILRRFPIGY